MKISVTDNYGIKLEEVYNPIKLETTNGEVFYISMRDSGFEFTYQDEWYSAQKGKIIKMNKIEMEKNDIRK